MKKFDGFRISEIMAKKAIGDITPSEREELDLWLAASSQNRRSYDRFMSGETRRGRIERLAGHDTEKTLGMINRRIRRHRIRTMLLRTASAAVLAGVALSSVYVFRTGTENAAVSVPAQKHSAIMSFDGKTALLKDVDAETEWLAVMESEREESDSGGNEGNIKIEVRRGNTYKLRLNDGTAVWLNSGTVIEYPEKFTGGVRDIRLCGEAFFDVARDPSQPFVVTTRDGVEVSVLGTKFNVQSYDDGDRVRVTLAEGSVEVNACGNRLLLKPDEQAVLDRRTGVIEVGEVKNMRLWTAWTEGEFYFEDTIGNILSAMEKRYGIDIICEGVPTGGVPGKFIVKAGNSDNFTVVLNALQKITGMTYTVRDRKVFIAFPA